jgi:hypothetical protein
MIRQLRQVDKLAHYSQQGSYYLDGFASHVALSALGLRLLRRSTMGFVPTVLSLERRSALSTGLIARLRRLPAQFD